VRPGLKPERDRAPRHSVQRLVRRGSILLASQVTQGGFQVWIATLPQIVQRPSDRHRGLQGPALDELVVEIPDLHHAECHDHLAVRQSYDWTRRTCSCTVRTSNKHRFRRGDGKIVQETIASTEASFVHDHRQAAMVSLDPLFGEQFNRIARAANRRRLRLVVSKLRQCQKVFRYARRERVVNRMRRRVTEEISEEMAESIGATAVASQVEYHRTRVPEIGERFAEGRFLGVQSGLEGHGVAASFLPHFPVRRKTRQAKVAHVPLEFLPADWLLGGFAPCIPRKHGQLARES